MTKARILLSSDYTYGPPMSLHDKKLRIEDQVKNARGSFAESGADCEVMVPGMEKDESGEYKFTEGSWDKISGYEFLSMMVRRGSLTKNKEGKLTLVTDREDVMSKLHPDTHADFTRFFPDGSTELDASEFSKYYEEISHQRVGNLVSCVNSPDCSIVFNMGGGSLATRDLLPKLIAYEGLIEDNPTTFIGFSDGTTLPFYLMTRLENTSLVQASGLYDPGYLAGADEKPIKLVPLGERRTESDISAPPWFQSAFIPLITRLISWNALRQIIFIIRLWP